MSAEQGNTYKAELLQLKNTVLDLLDQTRQFYVDNDDAKHGDAFRDLHEKLKNNEYSIVVVGEFSVGKSTFLNALMGKRMLPSFKSETTATVNFLRHTDEAKHGEAGCVHYVDGKTQDLENTDLKTVEKYVSTRGTDVAKNIEYLDLFLPSDFLKGKVTLVDTPGLNGIAAGHREITERQINKSHASIFLFSSARPGSKTDFETLGELSKKVPRIFLVLNQIDVIKESEGETVESVIDTLKQNYRKFFPDATTIPEIWPVSAFQALEARDDQSQKTPDERKVLEEKSRMEDFEARLMKFLSQGEKTLSELTAPIDQVLGSVKQSRDELAQEKNLLETKADGNALTNQIDALTAELEKLGTQKNKNTSDIRNKVRQNFKEIQEELSSKLEKLKTSKLAEIDSLDDLNMLNDYISRFEGDYLRRVRSLLQASEDALSDSIVEMVNLEYQNEAGTIETKLSEQSSDAVKVELQSHLDTTDRIAGIDFDSMKQQQDQLHAKMEALEAELMNCKVASAKYDDVRAAKRDVERRIASLEAAQDRWNQYQLPLKTGHYETRTVMRDRSGLIGSIVGVFAGKKAEQQQVYVEDASARNEAIKRRDEELKKVSSQAAQSQSQLKDLQKEAQRYAEAHAKVDVLHDKLARLQNEEIKLIDEQTAEMKQKREERVRQCHYELRNYCDGIQDEVEGLCKQRLKNMRDTFTTVIVESVSMNLQDLLNRKKGQIERLQQQMDASAQDKQKRLTELDAKITSAMKLLGTASDLRERIDSIPVDKIQNTTLG